MSWQITKQAAWKRWVTPKDAKEKAVHRWYLFPHSFTDDLVHALIGEWGLDEQDKILDPFVGAGTTLLAAKEMGIPSSGFDLSPLAILVSNTKTSSFSRQRLDAAWLTLERKLMRNATAPINRVYPELVCKALPGGRLEALDSIVTAIENLDCSSSERDFFRVALIAVVPRFSHAVANGGWLRWLNQGEGADNVASIFSMSKLR